MKNLGNIIEELENNYKNKKLLEEIRENFSKKPYLIEYRPMVRLTFYTKFLFAAISISCAAYWLYTLLLQTISFPVLAFALAVLLLVVLEIFKFRILPKLFTCYYASKKWDYGLIMANIILIILSVFLSVKGIEKYNREQRAITPTLLNEDSLRQEYTTRMQHLEKKYDTRINSLREEKANSKKEVMWQGKINMYHQPTATELANYTQQIKATQKEKTGQLKSLQKEKNKHLEKVIQHNERLLAEAQQKTSLNTTNLIAFAFLNEFLAFVCLWYMVFYQYRSLREIQLLEDISPIQLYPKDIGTLFQYVKNLWGKQPASSTLPIFGEKSSVNSGGSQENDMEIGFKLKSKDKKQAPDDNHSKEGKSSELNLLKNKIKQLEDFMQNQLATTQHIHSEKKVIIKQPPPKTTYNPEKLLSKHLDIVKEIRSVLPAKPNISQIQKKTGKDWQTVRKVYQAMLVLGQCENI